MCVGGYEILEGRARGEIRACRFDWWELLDGGYLKGFNKKWIELVGWRIKYGREYRVTQEVQWTCVKE